MNIAFEISPLLTASGSFGDKSGVYRYLTGLISSLKKENKIHHKFVLFTFNKALYKSQIDPNLFELFNKDDFIILNNYKEFIGEPKMGSFIKNILCRSYFVKILFKLLNKIFKFTYFYDYFRNKVHDKYYLDYLKKEFQEYKVTHIVHSVTGFNNIKGFINIQIIYDLTPVLFPLHHRKETIDLFNRQIEFSKNHCQGIITISKSTQKDLNTYFPITKKIKSIIIYPGVNKNIYKNEDNESFNIIAEYVKKHFQELNKKRYLIYFGTFEPRKNIIYLVKSFIDLQNEEAIPKDFKLLLIGGEGWGKIKSKIKSFINEEYPLVSKQNVIILDFLSDKYLYALLKNAYATVYPSLYGGFGLPVLESMAVGIPVIASNNSSIPEVGGRSILYYDVNNFLDLKNKIKYLVNDRLLAASLAQKGLIQSKKFNWKNSANLTFKFFNSLSESK